MSVQAISWVIDHSKHKGNPLVVLLMIANHARSDGTGAWPSVHTLAKESRLSDRTVQRCIATLSKSKELHVSKAAGPYGANLYSIRGVKLSPGGVNSGERGCQGESLGGDRAVSPNPSLTVLEDKEEIIQLIQDYHQNKTHIDEDGKRYKISPSTRKRIYIDESQTA
jgi:helix-turn-helix protein